jgi:hypothetical protein
LKKFITIILIIFIAVTSQINVFASGQNENLSLGKVVTASSCESGLDILFNPQNVVDGDNFTKWSSEYNDNEWIKIDLGNVCTVTEVIFFWENARPSEYKIQVSTDNLNWTDVVTVFDTQIGQEDVTFNPTDARYVKMQGVKRATVFGYLLYSFDVYGVNGSIDVKQISLLGDIKEYLNQSNSNQNLFFGVLIGSILGLIFWNIVKEVHS